jgi:phytoene dehydrogenase-like protein
MSKPDVLIVGAGLAGLCCARKLHQEGVSSLILEASDGPGGRVRTDVYDGFQLDRGFQVLLTSYPEAQAQLDFEALNLCAFVNGAMVRQDGRFFRLSDPWREPGTMMANLFSPVGTLADKFRMSRLRSYVRGKSIEEMFDDEEMSTMQALVRRRFSKPMIDRFFRPFLGGVMLDQKLAGSSRLFEFLFQMFAEGDVAVPAAGMQAIPNQLAASLPPDSIAYQERVHSLGRNFVKLMSGEVLHADNVVIATEGPEASRLLGYDRGVSSRSACCLYFSCREAPVEEPILVLGGGSRGPINNLAVMNLVSPTYAPPGENLVSITVVGWPTRDDQTLVQMVRGQLKRWYGLVAQEWRLLRIYRIEHALPVSFPMVWQQAPKVAPGLYVCGDHRATPSIQGAMESGRVAAEAVLRDLRGEPDGEAEAQQRQAPRLADEAEE